MLAFWLQVEDVNHLVVGSKVKNVQPISELENDILMWSEKKIRHACIYYIM